MLIILKGDLTMFKEVFLASVERALTEKRDVSVDDIIFMTYGEIEAELEFYEGDLDALIISLESDPIVDEFEQIYYAFMGDDSI